ncbi:MAG: c-type cytochrome biogenesis protein CcsB [Desulfobulbaceae bacterium]|uniref:Heme exporter protein C n=1 Tax=Candidatus Desulfobia pelagia TaxID=2841692 RepID=A0A8J6TC09_9BACT|nr:c-type cytochrome biogenesis protein CcsB [Candidatus Desulfobia pelagia]
MTSSQLLGISTLGYLLASAVYIATFIFKTKKSGIIGTFIILLTFVIQTVGIGLRWYESYEMGYGHAPMSNMYESLVFFSWSIIIFYILLEMKFKNRLLGAFAVPFAFVSMAYASFGKGINQEINPLIPALQSNWLIAHVVTCFIGYAAFAVACGLGIMYLMKATSDNKSTESLMSTLPDLKVIDDITHKTIIFGFLWLTGGIITGAVWANSAWGTYWSWDPKETWSLITWFIYAATLHARFTRGWQGKRIAWLAIIGFFAVMFTYFGVNFLLSGLHSYGSS